MEVDKRKGIASFSIFWQVCINIAEDKGTFKNSAHRTNELSDTWENFAGVSGILKTAAATPGVVDIMSAIRLHGSFNKSTYFEHQNEQADTDFASSSTAKVFFFLNFLVLAEISNSHRLQNLYYVSGGFLQF